MLSEMIDDKLVEHTPDASLIFIVYVPAASPLNTNELPTGLTHVAPLFMEAW